MNTFDEFMKLYSTTIITLIRNVSDCIVRDADAELIGNMIIYHHLYPSLRNKSMSEFILLCGRIMLRAKSIALKRKKQHRSNILQIHSSVSSSMSQKLKDELSELIGCQRILSDSQSMYTQMERLNDMIFGDYQQKLENVNAENAENADKTDIMVFPYETQIYLEIAFTRESLRNNFIENDCFNDLIRNKNQYFHGLYELDYLLEIYNVFWVKYRNQWDAQQVKEQDKLRKHYLGQCECCLAMYQSLHDDDETVKRTKMKEMAKTLNVNELIDWSDEEVETEQELQEFNDLANRLALLK